MPPPTMDSETKVLPLRARARSKSSVISKSLGLVGVKFQRRVERVVRSRLEASVLEADGAGNAPADLRNLDGGGVRNLSSR